MAEATWLNRIVGSDVVPAKQLVPNPRNFRTHPRAQSAALEGVLADVGWVARVIVNQRTGHLIDGHLRVSLALKTNDAVPVEYVDLSEEEEALILASFDPITGMAGTDPARLDALLREVHTGNEAIGEMLHDLAERSGVIPPATFNPADEWEGMPEFEQPDGMPARQIIVSFARDDDVADFARLLDQPITDQTKSVWHPAQRPQNRLDLAYVADEDAAQ